MDALIAFAAMGVFAAGIVAGIVGVVSVAIRQEERNLTLTSGPTSYTTWAGRWLKRGLCAHSAPHPRRGQDDGTRLAASGSHALYQDHDQRRPR